MQSTNYGENITSLDSMSCLAKGRKVELGAESQDLAGKDKHCTFTFIYDALHSWYEIFCPHIWWAVKVLNNLLWRSRDFCN